MPLLLRMGSSISCSNPIENTMNAMIFYPPNTPKESFEELNTAKSRLVTIMNGDQKISALITVPQQYKFDEIRNIKTWLIFSHGNATDVYEMSSYQKHLSNQLDVVTIFYDYPSYGLSNGKPNEENCYESSEIVIDFIMKEYGVLERNMLLVAQSIGTGILINSCSLRDWKTPIILISPYKSIGRVVCDSSIVSLIDKFETYRKLDRVNCPVKIFHGLQDTLIPHTHSRQIYNGLNNKILKPTFIMDADHNNILEKINIGDIQKVIDFMNK